MPTFTNTSVEKSVDDIISKFDWKSAENYKFTDAEIKEYVGQLTLDTTARSPEEVNKQNEEKFTSALSTAVFVTCASDKAVLPYDDIKEKDKSKKVDLDEAILKRAAHALVAFAFLHGNVTSKKFWIKVSGEKDKGSTYIGLPSLNVSGARSTLVHVFREDISSFLEKGQKNTLTVVLERSKVAIDDKKRKYLFPKGHLLYIEKQKEIRDDLNLIFKEMGKAVDKRDFKDLKFFK